MAARYWCHRRWPFWWPNGCPPGSHCATWAYACATWRPEHVYQVLHPHLRQDFPAFRSLEATPNNLPQQVTSFVGRERELGEVKDLLAKTRLLTLLGVGGLGKTRLSLQVAVDH